MRMRQLLAATVLLLGTSVAAHATVLATGSVYGGPGQTYAVCYVYNAGSNTNTITITSNQIIRGDGVIVPLGGDTCGALAGGQTCNIWANIVDTQPHSCKFVFNESKADIRGVMDIRQDDGTVLMNSNLY